MPYDDDSDYTTFNSYILTAEQEVRLDILRALIGQEGAASFSDEAAPEFVTTALTAFAEPLVEWVLSGRRAGEPSLPLPADGTTPPG